DKTGSKTPDFFIPIGQIPRIAEEIEQVERVKLPRILVAVSPLISIADRCFRRGFGTDIHHGWCQVGGNLRKRIGQRNGIGDDERLGFLLARFDPTRDDRPNDNADRKGCNNQGEIKQSLFTHGSSFCPFRRYTALDYSLLAQLTLDGSKIILFAVIAG